MRFGFVNVYGKLNKLTFGRQSNYCGPCRKYSRVFGSFGFPYERKEQKVIKGPTFFRVFDGGKGSSNDFGSVGFFFFIIFSKVILLQILWTGPGNTWRRG